MQDRRTLSILLTLSLAGVLQALALAWPFEGSFKGDAMGWLQFVGFVVFAALLDRSHGPRQAAVYGGVFALVWLTGSTWWLFIAMHVYGEMPSLLAGAAVLLLNASLALVYVGACALYRWLAHDGLGVAWRAMLFAAVWLLAELLRGHVFTGFPWGAVAYAHVDGVARHWASWVGVYGVCALLAFAAMWLGAQRSDRLSPPMGRLQSAWVFGLVGALSYAWVASPSQWTDAQMQAKSTTPMRVSLVQGNVPQDLKFGAGLGMALQDYREALMRNSSDLVVLPETALPVFVHQLPPGYWEPLAQRYAKGQQVALLGVPLVKGGTANAQQYTNSALGLLPQPLSDKPSAGQDAKTYRYDKHHLVPFGEFVPWGFRWFVDTMQIPLGDFGRGDATQALLRFKDQRIAPNICFEDLFGEEIAKYFADADNAPTLMVNMSNIAWFGNTVAIDQHLHISRMRAIEMNRPMLRATNTGATAIINAQGVVTHRLPSAVKATLTAEVRGVEAAVTPYAQWVSAYGLWPLWLLGLGCVLGAGWVGYQARHGHRRFAP